MAVILFPPGAGKFLPPFFIGPPMLSLDRFVSKIRLWPEWIAVDCDRPTWTSKECLKIRSFGDANIDTADAHVSPCRSMVV